MTEEKMIADAIELMKLKVKGFTEGYSVDDSWNAEEAEKELSKLLPNLPKILDELQGMENVDSFTRFFKHLGKKGLLSIPLNVWKVDNIPSLQVRWDAFLHWYRGHSFQMSYSDDADGARGRSSDTLAYDLETTRALPEELKPIIAFSHISQATSKYDEFLGKIKENPEIFNDFINTTQSFHDIECRDFDLNKFLRNFKDVENLNGRSEYFRANFVEKELGSKEDRVFGTMSFGKDYVAFTYLREASWKIFEFPTTKDKESFNWHYPVSGKRDYFVLWKRIAWALTLVCGITGDYNYLYPKSKNKIAYFDKGLFEETTLVHNMSELEDLCGHHANFV